jgi:TolB-like protein
MQGLKLLFRMKKIIIASLIVIILLIVGYFILPDLKAGLKKNDDKVRVDQSIAVLPFENRSNEPDREYFSDGFAEGILNALARLKGLKVCARTSSFKFRGKNIDLKKIGKDLAVGTILQGSVLREGDRVRIRAQLINVEDNLHLWSEQYDENIDDLYALQDKIASAIAKKLEITILEDERHVTGKKPLPIKEAYELYLRGRASWNLRTPPELKQGIDFFQQAIKIDPTYAVAYSGIADCYTALGYGSLLAPKEAFPKAFQAATKALELDSTLSEPHASLGFYRFIMIGIGLQQSRNSASP